MAIKSHGFDFGGELHNKFGIIMLFGVLILAFTGAFTFKTKEDAKWNT
jgi:uncharacterized iron-regulated membrane protein